MARQPRFVLASRVHLVVQQGHNQRAIVADDEDRRLWLALLRDSAATHRVVLHAWGLGTGQFRLLVTPPTAASLSRMMQTLGRRYVGGFNARHGCSGTLWNGRFRACVVEDGTWVLAAMRYVETGLIASPMPVADAPPSATVSSLAHHLGHQPDPGISSAAAYWALGNTPFERHDAYRLLAEAGLTPGECRAIETVLPGGRPLGGAGFVAQLEQDTARPLAPRRRGRPARQLASDRA